MHKWFVFNEFDQAAKAAAYFLAEKIGSMIHDKGECHVVLPGGKTPISCLGLLSVKTLPWDKVHWYLGDERCYPKAHPERNDVMLEKYFWSHLPDTNIYTIPAEQGAESAARAYRKIVNGIGSFDIAFLGMGEDGHTASLFPGNKALLDTRTVVPVYDSPKPPVERVSLSIATLKRANCKVVLVAGIEKAPIIARIKSGESLPINRIGEINWYVDEAAVSMK
jgi:6-phosphogluconolactonase